MIKFRSALARALKVLASYIDVNNPTPKYHYTEDFENPVHIISQHDGLTTVSRSQVDDW